MHKLQLKDADGQPIEGAFIEVGLKGEESTSKPSSRSSIPMSGQSDAISMGSTNDHKISQLMEDLDQLRREKEKIKNDNESKLIS